MTFYANGKLVCLEKINNEKSALWGGFKRKDKGVGTYNLHSAISVSPKR